MLRQTKRHIVFTFRYQPLLRQGLAGLFFLLTACNGQPSTPEKSVDRSTMQPGDEKLAGTVIGYRSNASGDVDHLGLTTGGDTLWFHFPPHLGRDILKIAHINHRLFIRYSGQHKKSPPKHPDSRQLIYLRSDELHQELNLAGIPPPPPRSGSLVELSGRPVLHNETKGVRFFTLSGRRIALPPKSSDILLPMIAGTSLVVVKGEQRDSTDGFVSLDGLPLVRARQISIDGINYILE